VSVMFRDAMTDHVSVILPRLSALNRGMRLVTLSVGGNDLDVAGLAM
jgi:hypothetical protein